MRPKNSIREEFSALIRNETWELVERPKDRGVIGCRTVLRNKYNADGVLDRRKAQVVAKGYSRRPGIDFKETFAPVARLNSIRLVTALAAEKGMIMHQLDVTTAFLNGEIEEEIFMEIPDMFE